MTRASYIDSYNFSFESLNIVAGGKSSLDAKKYLTNFESRENAKQFLKGYGFDIDDPVQAGELFGNFHEAMQFIKRYFLKEGNPDGLNYSIPDSFYTIQNMTDLLMMGTPRDGKLANQEEVLWAGIILKVMHTILHTDKDLRSRYFSVIQTQIFDRFYKHLVREDDQLYLRDDKGISIKLVEFETKAKKTRDSIIIKLLHKRENVAEELFDRIGVRFITQNKVDVLRVIKFLTQNYVIMANNNKPSRAQNSLIDLDKFKEYFRQLIKENLKKQFTEEEFAKKAEEIANKCEVGALVDRENKHSSVKYKAIHFTCRQLIHYRNPFFKDFLDLRNIAKDFDMNNPLAKKILSMNPEAIARDIRFFYPYEVQITDIESHIQNTAGEASHKEYKRSQLISAMHRIFRPLIEYKTQLETN